MKERKQPGPMRSMFGRIAFRYELANHLMSFFQDIGWRRDGVRQLEVQPGDFVLDAGAGTGDLVREVLRQQPNARVVASDITREMLALGKTRMAGDTHASWVIADALALPFAAQTFDHVISGFLLRNLPELENGLEEQRRVLKAGGRMVSIDTTPPQKNILKPFIEIYLRYLIPVIGRLVSGDGSAYSYLSESTRTHVSAERLVELMQKVGFTGAAFLRRTFGAAAIHSGRRPEK